MIPIPIWIFVALIATNIFTILVIIGIINLICYIHDMIKVDVDMRKRKL